jgi:hypothetical protein
MRRLFPLLLVVVTPLLTVPVTSAQESGAYVLTLGVDTTSVERYTRTKDRLEVDQVGRSPRVLRRKFTYDYRNGVIDKLSMIVTPPGADAPTQVLEARRDGDSLRLSTRTGNAAAVASAVAIEPGTIVLARTSPWAVLEGEIQKLARSRADTLGGTSLYLGAGSTDRYLLKKLGRDSVSVWLSSGDLSHVRIDKAGRVLGVRPLAGTFQVALTRPATLDVEALATAYRAREQGGTSLGMLSPRDTVRTTLPGGGTLAIDYGSPAKRGRVVFGGVVPYGQVWRTGANAATQLKVDRAIEIAGNAVPAGHYTMWTIPGAAGWKFILNKETGQWGTAHKPESDLFTTDMKVSSLPQVAERFRISLEPTATGGFVHMDWDMTRASFEYVVKPETAAQEATKPK